VSLSFGETFGQGPQKFEDKMA